jgi:hypothetical protein
MAQGINWPKRLRFKKRALMDTALLRQISVCLAPESDLEPLSCCLQLIELPHGAILFREGDPGDRFTPSSPARSRSPKI